MTWLLALGPRPRFLGEEALYRGPYAALMLLPGFSDTVRVPARFAMLMVLGLAVAAGLAAARLAARAGARARVALAVVLAAGIAADGWMTGLPIVSAPDRGRWPAQVRSAAAVLELPVKGDVPEIAAVYRSMVHGRRVMNGYSGFDPPYHRALRAALERRDGSLFAALAEAGPIVVGVDAAEEEDGALAGYVARQAGIEPLGTLGGRRFFLLPRVPPPPAPPRGRPLRIVDVRASEAGLDAGSLIDNDRATWWTSLRPQHEGETIRLELDAPHRVSLVSLAVGPFVDGFPRRLRIDTSLDGEAWRVQAEQETAGAMLRAIRDDPRDPELAVAFGPAEARFVRLTQVGSDPRFWWTIVDVSVLGR